ncbi:MAG: hypothetical protein GTO45_05905 [Candidatus Aminicenantes bacterium]|nr:hypothetical protein [Candidatus Aminicenantes bacterium]NIM84784.1 hypothetical protein [Candidatus Aminicenantes bacterium]NIN17619.1 hypothetical protein [Candidatus Aminicenantes bacterium]NIN41497.1 hypothetical protein [Candidatus Aminicenantes bacterium]NIN84271.1 hypothetical protein [Candidatus Aminicenantes bacterium]
MKERLLNEAKRIGDQLLEEAKTDDNGIYWETMTMDLDRNISFKTGESIYSGSAGVSLFFLELFKQAQDQRYMDAAVQGMKWVVNYCENNPASYYAFFTGRMGISYVLMRMYEFTGESRYVEQALATAKACTEFLNPEHGVDDLINGTSGALLGLLHLHAAAGEEWILKAIDAYIKHLVASAHHGPRGLYWDRSETGISGLCGFSHGAAGIGFVFLELGRYFQNETFYKLAEQAFLYERHFFMESRSNWPDLRKGIYTDEDKENHKKAFLENNLDFFTTGGDMNAWCHGAAGIGLSRLRAFQLLNKKIYEDEARVAIKKTIITNVETNIPEPTFTLCHGGGGNAELFIYAYQIFNDDQYLELAEKVAVKAIDFYEKNKFFFSGFHYGGDMQDRSLFMGNAGIGYFYLRLLNPFQVPSIQAPTVDEPFKPGQPLSKSQYPFITISTTDVQKQLLQKNFQRTLYCSENLIPQKLDAFFSESAYSIDAPSTLMESFITFIANTIDNQSLAPGPKEILSDIFDLELEKRRMDEAIKSHSLLNIKDIVLNQQGEEIIKKAGDDNAFLELMLQLEPYVQLKTTRWNWNLSDQEEWKKNINQPLESEEEEEEMWAVLLKPMSMGILETELSPFTYTILAELCEPNRVEQVMQATIDAFESLTPDQETMLRGKIIDQIKHLLLSGILVEAKPDKK